MEKMNQVSVTEFMSKSKEEMYDIAVEMVEKYNRLIDICNDSAERMAELIVNHDTYTSALNKDLADKAAKIDLLEKEIEGRKEGYTALKELMDTKYISIEDHNDICKTYETNNESLKKQVEYLTKELENTCRTKELDLKGHQSRETALVNALADNNDEIKKLKESIEELKKKNFDDFKRRDAFMTNQVKCICELEKKIKNQRANLDGINKTLEIRNKENESLIAVKNNQEKELKAHEEENARLTEKITKLKTELKMQEDLTRNWKNKYVEAQKEIDEWESDTSEYETIIQYQELIDGLNKDLNYWKEAFETQATSLAEIRKLNDELVDTLNKSSDRIDELEEENLKLSGRVDTDFVNKLIQETDYYKEQERIRTDQLRATESKVEELKQEIEMLNGTIKGYWDELKNKEDDHGRAGFKRYIEYLIEEEERAVPERFKERLNEEITEIFEKEEETVKYKPSEIDRFIGFLKGEVDKKRIVDISEGVEKILGVSRELFVFAIKVLVDDGYQEIIGRIPRATNSYVYMDMHVLAAPDVETKETANAENIKSLDFDIPCGEDAIE